MGTARVAEVCKEEFEHKKGRIKFPRINFFTYCLIIQVTQKPVV